jgi:hypothetical protein
MQRKPSGGRSKFLRRSTSDCLLPSSTPAPFESGPEEKLKVDLAEVPDVREDVVARGKRLVQDPNYPPPPVLRRVAELLARRIATED